MTDRSLALIAPPPRRRLGRATRAAVAGSFAVLLALVLGLAWVQAPAPTEPPSHAQPTRPGDAAGPVAPTPAPASDPQLAQRPADRRPTTPTPARKRELQQRLQAMRMRGALSPDDEGRIYAAEAEADAAAAEAAEAAQAKAPPPPLRPAQRPDPRPDFYRALSEDFAASARSGRP